MCVCVVVVVVVGGCADSKRRWTAQLRKEKKSGERLKEIEEDINNTERKTGTKSCRWEDEEEKIY